MTLGRWLQYQRIDPGWVSANTSNTKEIDVSHRATIQTDQGLIQGSTTTGDEITAESNGPYS